jgi:predicted transcriptional regulator
MSKILLSIHPEHVDSIVRGEKLYEFRKVRCRADVDTIVIYATAPRKEVIGEIVLEEIIEDDIDNVWRLTGKASGITYDFFREYYRGKKKAIAYKLGALWLFSRPQSLGFYGVRCAPQSFIYVENNF